MFPCKAAYETSNIQNILFKDREDISLFLSSRGRNNKENKLEEAAEKGREKTKSKALGEETK